MAFIFKYVVCVFVNMELRLTVPLFNCPIKNIGINETKTSGILWNFLILGNSWNIWIVKFRDSLFGILKQCLEIPESCLNAYYLHICIQTKYCGFYLYYFCVGCFNSADVCWCRISAIEILANIMSRTQLFILVHLNSRSYI